MKKQLLLLFAVFFLSFASAQVGSLPDISVCGGQDIFFGDQTLIALNGQSPNDYTVTYHLSQADADAGVNQLTDPMAFSASQEVFVRVTENANPANFETGFFFVTVFPMPNAPNLSFTMCDMDGVSDGMTIIDLGAAAQQIWGETGASPNTIAITFYETQSDAFAQANPLPWTGYMNTTPAVQLVYYVAQDLASGCFSVGTVNIVIIDCGGPCAEPSALTVSNISETTATLSWIENGNATSWGIYMVPIGGPAPIPGTQGIWSTSNPFVVTGLSCGADYSVYVQSYCSTNSSGWVGPFNFVTMPCTPQPGFPGNMEMCSDTASACFDLTSNTQNILGTLNPSDYTVTYYPTQADASNQTNAIASASNYCVTQPGLASTIVFARLDHPGFSDFQIFEFALTVRQVSAAAFTPAPMYQCDTDGNGIVTFDLTTVSAQLNTTNPLSFYTNSLDATSVTGTNALPDPTAFNMSVTNGTQQTTIFVRESIAGNCDNVYSLQLFANSNCNAASLCVSANSLCSSLGVPFLNTTNSSPADPSLSYDCLFTQPNPTWFYLPISVAGNLSFQISQQTVQGQAIDVDFICWGPFSTQTNLCNAAFLNINNQVSCSYSSAAVENFTIPNAQPGQYYVLMVTNFSNQPGYITISQTNAGAQNSGDIDCTGIRMTAFLDSNANGAKDSGESNFSLGQFHFEKNNNGDVHHIASPLGTYSIYDLNAANTYDIGFDVDPTYASNYAVSPASYANVPIVPGSGMTEYYFPVTITNPYNDLVVTIIPGAQPNPGFNYSHTVRYTNLGSQTTSGNVSYTKPAEVSILNVSDPNAVTNASGFTLNFTDLLPFESRTVVVTMQVPTIPTVALGQILTASADVAPLAGDVAPENNTTSCSQIIIGSYDPNDKTELRGKYVLFSDFGSEDFLYYTVRFENTGTAPALNVRISDVLEEQLDETSVRMVAASHNYVMDRTDNVLTWNFDNILLPASSANPEGAKGFVQFKVKPKAGYAVGDVIQNTASIYFDYNPAIITNTFETHFVQSLGVPRNDASAFAMYPNPADNLVTVSLSGTQTISAITVYDVLGKKVLSKPASGSTDNLDVSGLGSGMYFLEITTSTQEKATKKLVVK